MNAEAVKACDVARWHATFKGVTFKTVVVPLPKAFVEYLVSDGIYLEADSKALPKNKYDPLNDDTTLARGDGQGEAHSSSDDADGGDDEDGSGVVMQDPKESFPELIAAMEAAIAEIGGDGVLPKLNWSCPRDATWVSATQTMRCTNVDEILLLLKSSDRIVHDIEAAFDSCPESERPKEYDHVLALKAWHSLKPERNFRCFVRTSQLVGISQRDVQMYFPQLKDDSLTLTERICDFYDDSIKGKFALKDFTFDVYVASNGTAKLIDFNPVGGSTQPLMFTWGELGFKLDIEGKAEPRQPGEREGDNEAAEDVEVDFRIVSEEAMLTPGEKMVYGLPFDMLGFGDRDADDRMRDVREMMEAANRKTEAQAGGAMMCDEPTPASGGAPESQMTETPRSTQDADVDGSATDEAAGMAGLLAEGDDLMPDALGDDELTASLGLRANADVAAALGLGRRNGKSTAPTAGDDDPMRDEDTAAPDVARTPASAASSSDDSPRSDAASPAAGSPHGAERRMANGDHDPMRDRIADGDRTHPMRDRMADGDRTHPDDANAQYVHRDRRGRDPRRPRVGDGDAGHMREHAHGDREGDDPGEARDGFAVRSALDGDYAPPRDGDRAPVPPGLEDPGRIVFAARGGIGMMSQHMVSAEDRLGRGMVHRDAAVDPSSGAETIDEDASGEPPGGGGVPSLESVVADFHAAVGVDPHGMWDVGLDAEPMLMRWDEEAGAAGKEAASGGVSVVMGHAHSGEVSMGHASSMGGASEVFGHAYSAGLNAEGAQEEATGHVHIDGASGAGSEEKGTATNVASGEFEAAATTHSIMQEGSHGRGGNGSGASWEVERGARVAASGAETDVGVMRQMEEAPGRLNGAGKAGELPGGELFSSVLAAASLGGLSPIGLLESELERGMEEYMASMGGVDGGSRHG